MSDPATKKSAEHQHASAQGGVPVVVKKYANRRLYNTESSSYITLENLAEMIRKGRDFVVFDAKTGEDITRQVLTQIIVEEEGKGEAMLPTSFLRQLIGFYGEDMQGLVPRYLEQAMNAFSHQQEQVRSAMHEAMGKLIPPGMATMGTGMPANLEELGRQNMAMMERAMILFSPFYLPPGSAGEPAAPPQSSPTSPDPSAADLAALRAEVETLRQQLAAAQAAVAKPGKTRGGP